VTASEAFADETIGQVGDHYANVIGQLTRKPAVIGHSSGGLLAQIVAGRAAEHVLSGARGAWRRDGRRSRP